MKKAQKNILLDETREILLGKGESIENIEKILMLMEEIQAEDQAVMDGLYIIDESFTL